MYFFFFFFSSRRRHTRLTCDWSSDVCSSDLAAVRADDLRRGQGRLAEPGRDVEHAVARFDPGERDQPLAHAAGVSLHLLLPVVPARRGGVPVLPLPLAKLGRVHLHRSALPVVVGEYLVCDHSGAMIRPRTGRARRVGAMLPLVLGAALLAGQAGGTSGPKGGTLRVVMRPDLDFVDPALARSPEAQAVERATCRTLYDASGPRLVPDAATAVPSVSRDGL